MATEKRLVRDVRPGEHVMVDGRRVRVTRVDWIDHDLFLHVLHPDRNGVPAQVRFGLNDWIEVTP